jgi:opacity protein-like surface antigen
MVFSQTQSVQSTPIAVNADGLAGEAGEDEATMQARAELRASKIQKGEADQETQVDPGPELGDTSPLPPDGELLAEPKVEPPSKPKPVVPIQKVLSQRYLHLKSALVASQWKKVSPLLRNGSSVFGFGVYQQIRDNMGASLSLDFTHGFGGSLVPEETRMFALNFKGDWSHPLTPKVHALASGGLVIADYQLRKKIGANQNTETYQRFGTGTALGLHGGMGLRTIFSKDVFVDFGLGYLQYFSSPQKNFGGPQATLSLQFRL